MPVTSIGSQPFRQRVLETGSFVTPVTADEVEISVHDLRFVFRFVTGSTPKVRAAEGSKQTLIITFEGFSGPLPTVWQGEVGTFAGESLWVVVSIAASGDAPRQNRQVSYTFSTGRPRP
ncbi:DUF6864 domain-containing function [Mesorhizobium sangaii]|uniref:DUF6864 domain-containing function n=1 Tax=Mesorhizobium sangaii TaxID=505389 RepID=UPI003CCD3A00